MFFSYFLNNLFNNDNETFCFIYCTYTFQLINRYGFERLQGSFGPFQPIAKTLNGPPLPPLIFIGIATIVAPLFGSLDRFIKFSIPGIFFGNKICISNKTLYMGTVVKVRDVNTKCLHDGQIFLS